MGELAAPGLTVDWLNGWLAAIGVTVLVPNARLRWSSDAVPHAVFAVPDDGPSAVERIAAALPTVDDLASLAIARPGDGGAEFARKVALDTYRLRAGLARAIRDWSLSSSVTDLVAELPPDGLQHSPFDPSAPRGVTLWERVVACRRVIGAEVDAVARTMSGFGVRASVNGLGFDVRRLVAGVRPGALGVDPVVELLAFCALGLFPVRGDGRAVRTRGWTGPAMRRGSFRWFAWTPWLDRWAIDALLDAGFGSGPEQSARLGVTAWYQSVPYQGLGSADVTRAYGGEPL